MGSVCLLADPCFWDEQVVPATCLEEKKSGPPRTRHPKGQTKDNMQRRHEFAIMCDATLIAWLVTIISRQVALAHHRFHCFCRVQHVLDVSRGSDVAGAQTHASYLWLLPVSVCQLRG